MKVIADEPWGWFLFNDDGKLYLNVLVEHGAISFDVTAEISAEQASNYAREGRDCIERLAGGMRRQALMRQWSAPALPLDWAERSLAAVHEWQKRRGG